MSKLKFLYLGFIVIIVFGCKSTQISKKISKQLNSDFFENQFTGLLVYDPVSNDTLYNFNADKYFTPASNTKIFTLYTGLQYLPKNIPSFKYSINKDTLTVLGTGDPTFLHPYFQDSTALKMFKNYKKVDLILNNLEDKKYGPGWAWDDYDSYYSPEKSSFPMYGNIATINFEDTLNVSPKALEKNVLIKPSNYNREPNSNQFYYQPKKDITTEIPMVIDSLLIDNLWNQLLPNTIQIANYSAKKMEHTAFSGIKTDSLYKRMMQESDNFLAEQILILASSTLSDTLSSNIIRKKILENQLSDLKQQPRWVDGSGLSRYNLFTPTSFVQVLTKLYTEIPRERLFNFFPVGGKSGTLENWYAGNPTPYIYAKSGTLSNNYCLSGFLITKSNKVLIFSFMNNHYRMPTNQIKKKMQAIFELLRDKY